MATFGGRKQNASTAKEEHQPLIFTNVTAPQEGAPAAFDGPTSSSSAESRLIRRGGRPKGGTTVVPQEGSAASAEVLVDVLGGLQQRGEQPLPDLPRTQPCRV
jgi:purine nucleoside phosphorylase